MASPLRITYILYDPKDVFSTASALIALFPLCIMVVYLTLFYTRREIELLFMYIGQIVSHFFNTGLKHIFRHPRPDRKCLNAFCDELSNNFSSFIATLGGYGMPSNHAQHTAYLAGYLLLWCFFRAQNLPRLVFMCFSRVYLHYHTIWQVIVGSFVGIAFSAFWFFFVGTLRKTGVINAILYSRIGAFLYIKDTMNEEHNTFQKEWKEWIEKQNVSK
ncbi:hypothetical protein PORY_001072 [Pneumocystis oryctolagi]|uniref:Uncharacterized protein n=1 Tax=Pneumocystis oryctolagi TaxID=42067 RepID=A0ACB7CD82_9ASCO|nr:hypothetical protein PORY_001072 [Pneumocystis oryctolagi]